MRNPHWLKASPDGFTLSVKVKPCAHKNDLFFNESGVCVIRLKAVAEDGKANAMLLKYLSKYFNITQKQITLLSGHKGRNKILRLTLSLAEQIRLRELLDQLT